MLLLSSLGSACALGNLFWVVDAKATPLHKKHKNKEKGLATPLEVWGSSAWRANKAATRQGAQIHRVLVGPGPLVAAGVEAGSEIRGPAQVLTPMGGEVPSSLATKLGMFESKLDVFLCELLRVFAG